MKVTKNEHGMTVIEIETAEGFSAFRMGLEDKRNWSRHPETRELNNYVIDHKGMENIAVKYGDSAINLKNR